MYISRRINEVTFQTSLHPNALTSGISYTRLSTLTWTSLFIATATLLPLETTHSTHLTTIYWPKNCPKAPTLSVNQARQYCIHNLRRLILVVQHHCWLFFTCVVRTLLLTFSLIFHAERLSNLHLLGLQNPMT